MQHSMISTAFTLNGFRIIKDLGLVRGITVRSLSWGGMFKGSFQMLSGGQLKLYTGLCEKAREEAFELMIKHAEELGANGIVGVRYDTNPLQELASEVLCYGTAVMADSL
ncbi:MAG: YbjQ family protein [Candidatus Omnitrophica bacterium]|nr:YbjQ family protein [Candidatus Omnitrophota bacterium]